MTSTVTRGAWRCLCGEDDEEMSVLDAGGKPIRENQWIPNPQASLLSGIRTPITEVRGREETTEKNLNALNSKSQCSQKSILSHKYNCCRNIHRKKRLPTASLAVTYNGHQPSEICKIDSHARIISQIQFLLLIPNRRGHFRWNDFSQDAYYCYHLYNKQAFG